MILTAELPTPPSSNTLFTHYNGHRIISRAYKAWRLDAGRQLLEQWKAQDRPTISRPYQVYIRVNVNHQRDISNCEKAVTDLIVATIPDFPDDAWMNRLVIERDRTVEGCSVEVVTLSGEIADGK